MHFRMGIIAVAVASSVGIAACGGMSGFASTNQEIISSAENDYIASLSANQKTGTVQFVNSSDATRQTLDETCGLQSDAARQIDKHKLKKGWFKDIWEIADVPEVGVWNLGKTVECATIFGWIAEPVTTTTYDFDELSSELQAKVQVLIAAENNRTACDPEAPESGCGFQWSFDSLETTTTGGVPVQYVVTVSRWIDPEGGIKEYAEYTLDSNLAVIGVYRYV